MSKDLKNQTLFTEIQTLIEQSKQRVAIAVNEQITLLYWHIGKRINQEILGNKRAEYGKEIIVRLSQELQQVYGKGWSEKHLRHCLRFAETFGDVEILSTLQRELSWSHIKSIIYLDDPLKREFYIRLSIHERWSTRVLQERINSMLYERTAISKKPEDTIIGDLQLLKSEQKLSPDLVFRDPYFLDFLGLHDSYSEKDLESAILAELQSFIIEIGSDFAFLARQKRITIDHEDYYIDLLFYHRRLKSLIAIDLKIDKFKASYKGQMELYLRWLEKYEMVEGENLPIGLILCTDKNEEHIELLKLEESNIKVASYLTVFPEFHLLQNKLHNAIDRAQAKLSQREQNHG
jgi:predicted nuclease of restriction endonuclease-like (RecB) superfamily